MKDFIQNKLRLVLEGKLAEALRPSNKKDYEKFKYLESKYTSLYGKHPYFMNKGEGNGIVKVFVSRYGNVTVGRSILPIDKVKGQDGIASNAYDRDGWMFYISIARGIDHPEDVQASNYDAVTRKYGEPEYDTVDVPIAKGVTLQHDIQKPGSPASDANIKAHILYGDIIGDKIQSKYKNPPVTYTSDASGKDRAVDAMGKSGVDAANKKLDFKTKKDAPKGFRENPEIKKLTDEVLSLQGAIDNLRGRPGRESRDKIKGHKMEIKKKKAMIAKLNDEGSGLRKWR